MVASQWWDISTFPPATNIFQEQYSGQKYGRYLVQWVNLWETKFSTVFYIVRSVLKFDYKLVINRTTNIWRLVQSYKTLDFDRSSVFFWKFHPEIMEFVNLSWTKLHSWLMISTYCFVAVLTKTVLTMIKGNSASLRRTRMLFALSTLILVRA